MTKRLMVSNLTNTIYLTNVKQDKKDSKLYIATGEKQDYTDQAIRAVFEWFMNNHKENEPSEAFELRFPNCPYVLTMTKEESK